MDQEWQGDVLRLPPARRDGPMSLEAVMARRRSVRTFREQPLDLAAVGQLLWAAQGISGGGGLRTAPSAGARYPVEAHGVVAQGVFHYRPADHSLLRVSSGDRRAALAAAAFGQPFLAYAPLTLVLTCVFSRTLGRYGEARGMRYLAMDVGHAAQNVLLQAVALDLGSVPVGAFDDDGVRVALGLPLEHTPLYLLPVGSPA
jgi:SagB-type dehydrogenase family enzyme